MGKHEQADKTPGMEAEHSAEEQAMTEVSEEVKAADIPEVYGNGIRLVIPPPARHADVEKFRESLEQVEGLKITISGGSVKEGSLMALSLEKPTKLLQVLNEIPLVDNACEKKGKIIVTLKTEPDVLLNSPENE